MSETVLSTHGLVMRQILQPGAENRLHCESLLKEYFETLQHPRQS